jgi:hypothetical protein
MPRKHPEIRFQQLAEWVAEGKEVPVWCQENLVPPGTAYRWRATEEFRRLVAEHRRHVVDRAIGKMAENLDKAVDKIVDLIDKGQDDCVKLAAARTLIDKLLDVQSHAELKAELQQLHERLAAEEKRRA